MLVGGFVIMPAVRVNSNYNSTILSCQTKTEFFEVSPLQSIPNTYTKTPKRVRVSVLFTQSSESTLRRVLARQISLVLLYVF
jgi:hypothetical protein